MTHSVGIPIALGAEGRCLFGPRRRKCIQGRSVWSVPLPYDVDLMAVRSGVGIENALQAGRWLVRQGVAALLSVGVAGGLQPGLLPGDLIVAEKVVEQGSDGESEAWDSDGAVVEFAYSTLLAEGMSVRKGSIISTQTPLLSAQGKTTLYSKTNALIVDMESSAVARVAAESDLPFLALRVVSDSLERTPGQDLAGCLDQSGKIRLPLFLRNISRKPSLIPELFRTAMDFAVALSSLKRAWRMQVNHHLPALLIKK